MARPIKVEQEVKVEAKTDSVLENKVSTLELEIEILKERITELETKVVKKATPLKSINKVEDFNGESETKPYDDNKLRLNALDKLTSAKNAIKILPPNLMIEGRHTKENIGAICGFIVTEEMMELLYES
jgi:hypothetical protein